MSTNVLRELAIGNALSSIEKEARLPHHIFTRTWSDYLFFESDGMFDCNFIEAKNIILHEEGSSEIALVNLRNASSSSRNEQDVVFLDGKTTYPEYFSILKGDGSPLNWIFWMDRYVCASDKGEWCIYCEKENDIAVFAVGQTFSRIALSQLRAVLRAESIEAIYAPTKDRLFDFDKLVVSWKGILIADYRR